MDIYLTELDDKDSSFRFPAMPEKIKVKNKANYQSFNIISLGEIKIPNGMKNCSISWSGFFFGDAYRNAPFVKYFRQPKRCIAQLNKWQKNGTPLKLLVTDTRINEDVTIESFEYTKSGGSGNIEYSVTFAHYDSLKIYTTKETQKKSSATSGKAKKKARSSKKDSRNKQYVIKYGDTLWGLAVQNYGSGIEWRKIYDANKNVLEKAAKKQGYPGSDGGNRIFPGTSIIIP